MRLDIEKGDSSPGEYRDSHQIPIEGNGKLIFYITPQAHNNTLFLQNTKFYYGKMIDQSNQMHYKNRSLNILHLKNRHVWFFCLCVIIYHYISEEDDENQNEAEDEDESVMEEEESHHSTARPRRITEIPNEKIKKIPEANALFIFSKTNK